MFEVFWDSECPRFGDDGARGFAAWFDARKSGVQVAVASPRRNAPAEPAADLGTLAPWQRWIQLETWREQAHWRPWVPDHAAGETDDDCDDPDRVVVLDDVAGHLVVIADERLREELICRFFEFCGVAMRRRHSSMHPYVMCAPVANSPRCVL